MARLSLMKCKKGDVLISKHGKAFIYSHYDKKRPYPHIIFDAINEKIECTRTTSGHVMKIARIDEDHDIVKIIHINP